MTREGYGQAYQDGFHRTVRLLRSRGASMDNAEDAAQAAWLRGWQKLDQLRDEGMITSWINSIAINCHRRKCKYDARYQRLPEFFGSSGIDLAPLDAAKVLTLSPPRDRVLFEHQLSGLTTEEIARKHGVSTTAIRIRILRARRAVRASVEVRADNLVGLRKSGVREHDCHS